jgi:hypothetical protein
MNFKINSRTTGTNQSTPYYSALAIAVVMQDVLSLTFEAIGVAVALWSLSS